MLQICYKLADGSTVVMAEKDELEIKHIHDLHAWAKQVMTDNPPPEGATWFSQNADPKKKEQNEKEQNEQANDGEEITFTEAKGQNITFTQEEK